MTHSTPDLRRIFLAALTMTFVLLTSAGIAGGGTLQQDLPAALVGNGTPPAGETVHYFSADSKAAGYPAVPSTPGPHGGVILIHEWNGLVDRIRQVADALAAEGYVTLAADLYSGRTGANRDENMALVRETLARPERLIANLDAAASFLRSRSDVSGKIGAIGWCYGGGVALSYALGGEHHQATAIFYGRLLDDPEELKHLDHEIYGTFGRNDRSPSPEQVDRFAAALRQAGVANDIHIYDEVGHGFWLWVERDDRAREPAADAWRRLKAYLKRTLGQ